MNSHITYSDDFMIKETRFEFDNPSKTESLFTQANGYLALRCSTEEAYCFQKRDMFVNGVFDKAMDDEVSEIANLPDIINLELYKNGKRICLHSSPVLSYERTLDISDGLLTRKIRQEGHSLTYERFVSMAERHLAAQRVRFTGSEDCTISIITGIDGQETNMGSQHFHEGVMRFFNLSELEMTSRTVSSGVTAVISSSVKILLDGKEIGMKWAVDIKRRAIYLRGSIDVKAGSELTICKLSCIHSSRDAEGDGSSDDALRRSREEREVLFSRSFDDLMADSSAVWKRLWENCDVKITGNERDQALVRFALYHLLIMTDGKDDRLGIGAKGLSGEGYKGHSFWDTEIFLLPFYQFTQPEKAEALLSYRWNCLESARKKAAEHGFRGAMFPWESAWIDDGETTPLWGGADIVTGTAMKILTGELELHVTADIAYAVQAYYETTSDDTFMNEKGYRLIGETAMFWASFIQWDEDGSGHIRNVIGPDEYKEHVDDNAYTNYMVHHNLKLALRYKDRIRMKDFDEGLVRKAAEGLYLPQPDENGIIEQFAGYHELMDLDLSKYRSADVVGTIYEDYNMDQLRMYKVSKQADTLLLFILLAHDFSPETAKANYDYYEERCLHDSSLSRGTHCLIAERTGRHEEAYRFFEEGLLTDFGSSLKSSAEGIHSACMGSIWQDAVPGFCGIEVLDGALSVNPHLPPSWDSIAFRLFYQGQRLHFSIAKEKIGIVNEGSKAVRLKIRGEEKILEGGCEI